MIRHVCVGGDPKDSLSPKNVDVCVVFISVAMSPLSHHVLVVKGGLAGSLASQHVSFSSIVATWYCWTKNVSAVTNAQEEHLFGKKNSWPTTAFMEAKSRATRVFCLMQQNGSQVSVVGFRSTLRVGLGSLRRSWALSNLATPGDEPPTAKHCKGHIAVSEFFAHVAEFAIPAASLASCHGVVLIRVIST